MAFATGSGRRLAYIAEVTNNTTPATPTFKVLRFTGGGITLRKTTAVSDEIRIDRNVTDLMHLGSDWAGTIPLELTYGTLDDIWAQLLFSSWSSDVIENGNTPPAGLTFEETRELGATDSYSRYTGTMVNTFSMDLTARAKITCEIGVMSRLETLGTAIIAGATYTAANDNPVLTSSAHVAALTIDGSTSHKVRSLNFTVNNNMFIRPVISSLYSDEIGYGKIDVSGQFEVYFVDNALYTDVLAHGGGALTFTVGLDTTEKYTFLLPNIKYGDGELVGGGNTDDMIVRIPFTAIYDATEGSTLKITRAVA